MNRLKILAVACACSPAKGSEFGVGWGWVRAIAANHDITVITADYNSDDIEKYQKSHQPSDLGNLQFIYVKNRPWHYRPHGLWLKIEDSLAKPIMNIAYQDWLRCAFEEAKKLLEQTNYDLVHLITYVGWRFPGRFYQLDIPFVWGPIGGMKNTPWHLLPILGPKGAIYYGARNLINSLQLRTLRGPRRALQAAGEGVIAATSEIQQELLNRFRAKSHVICEVGPPQLEVESPALRNVDGSFRICWSGLHLPGKALHLLLQAVAHLPKTMNYSIEILGDGPRNRAWRSLASRLVIGDRCHWHGWVPRERSLEIMRDSHVFVITSLKDLTSTVAVEAISLGLPIVSMDHCGFADLVTGGCGIKIDPESQHQIISDLANALLRLYRDEGLRRRLAHGALIRSQDYTWQRKMDCLNQVYALTLGSQSLPSEQGQREMVPTADVAN
jgi:glycosyltransferase involved in cell wall biosynthesis